MYRVMIVDDNMANLIMARKTLEDEYEVIPVSSGISALECLNDMPELPDLVLLDVDMPNVNGFQVISEMKNVPKLVNIPIIFLTAQDDDTTELESYNLGAMDYIRKPYTANLLKKRVDIQIQLLSQRRKLAEMNNSLNNLVQDKNKKNLELQYSIVAMFVDLMTKRDGFGGDHARRVEKYMDILISAMVRNGQHGLSADDATTICFASQIHDIGKLCIADQYIINARNNQGSEFENGALQTHTTLGADMLSKVTQLSAGENNFMNYAYNMCRSHHERWDGNGYPDRLAGEKIPLEARALAIVNTYDNLRSIVTDGKILSHQEAMMKIKFMKFTSFDPSIADIFLSVESDIRNVAG
ncbi:MAG: response regulator [Lachnospiraceae bacterium]|nr:response regulator [Lachnospiraceae bacterium]